MLVILGSISNIDDDANYRCKDGSSPEIRNKVISGVVAAASSVTSIQVANLLKLFKIPQVNHSTFMKSQYIPWGKIIHCSELDLVCAYVFY